MNWEMRAAQREAQRDAFIRGAVATGTWSETYAREAAQLAYPDPEDVLVWVDIGDTGYPRAGFAVRPDGALLRRASPNAEPEVVQSGLWSEAYNAAYAAKLLKGRR